MKYLFVYYAAGGLLGSRGNHLPSSQCFGTDIVYFYIFVIEISVPNSGNYY